MLSFLCRPIKPNGDHQHLDCSTTRDLKGSRSQALIQVARTRVHEKHLPLKFDQVRILIVSLLTSSEAILRPRKAIMPSSKHLRGTALQLGVQITILMCLFGSIVIALFILLLPNQSFQLALFSISPSGKTIPSEYGTNVTPGRYLPHRPAQHPQSCMPMLRLRWLGQVSMDRGYGSA